MTHWIRYKHENKVCFGQIDGDHIQPFSGNLFDQHEVTGERVLRDDVEIMTPCDPGKMLGLWNNFHATATKNDLPIPDHPWYFVKTPNTYAAAGTDIHKPKSCSGKILFEAELAVVIGKTCSSVSVDEIDDYIFGYTCLNDVTAFEYLFGESFDHWTRAKCFDGFGVFGPTIATDVEPDELTIKAFLSGDDQHQERQNYPVSDMIFKPREIVSHVSHDMTLEPGDVIACGTSLGAGAMKPGWQIEIAIDGVGSLVNTFVE